MSNIARRDFLQMAAGAAVVVGTRDAVDAVAEGADRTDRPVRISTAFGLNGPPLGRLPQSPRNPGMSPQ